MPGLNIDTPRWCLPLLPEGIRNRAIYGGRGSGKSHFLGEYGIERSIMQPLNIVCLREIQKSLKQSVKQLLTNKIKKLGLLNSFEIQREQILGENGSVFTFQGLQDHTADTIKSLEDVDHSGEIKDTQKLLKEKNKELKIITTNLKNILIKLENISKEKKNSDIFDRLSLSKEKTEIEIDRMRVDYREKTSLLKDYERNVDFIEENRKLESKILGYNQLLETLNVTRDTLRTEIQDLNNDITLKETNISDNEKIIEQILKEEEVLKIFEVYNRMIGKNGISKLVLSSVIPIINYELTRLLDEVCDFEIQLEINNKNEVDFILIKNNINKKLKSGSGLETTLASLALRCVLGRVSTLPKPNVIVFDEVLGKVANINLDYVKIFFDKIKKMYETILLISHNPIIQDWADKIITVEKNNDISSLQIK